MQKLKQKIPEKFKIYFWDADFEKLDLEENKYFIIARLYTKGDFDAINWIYDNYSDEDVKETAKTRRALDPIVANYLQQKYKLKKEEMAYYQWSDGEDSIWKY